jgi:hypothetical protein
MSISPFSQNYKEPQPQSQYFKMKEEGSYLVRILTPKDQVIAYWVDFSQKEDGSYSKNIYPYQEDGQKPTEASQEAKLNWALAIFNKDTNQVQIWEIPQKSIKNFLLSIVRGKIKNDYTKFDIQITKTGKGIDTEYSLLTGDTELLNKEELEIVKNTKFNLNLMEKGENPFEVEKKEPHPDTFVDMPM